GEPSKVERAAAEDGDGLCVAECLDHEAAAPVNRGLDPGSAGGDDLRAAAERGFARAAGEDNLGAAAADRCEVRERAGEDFLLAAGPDDCRYRVAEHLVEAAAADLRAAGESADSHELEARDGGGRRGASRCHDKLPGTLDEQPDRRSARGNQ